MLTKLLNTNLEKFFITVVAFFTAICVPIVDILLFTGLVIFVDTFTGVWAAIARGEKITSTEAKRIVPKLILYPLAIIVASGAEYLVSEIPFIKGAALLLIMVEGKSVLENMSDILGYDVLLYVKTYMLKGKKGIIDLDNKKVNDNS